jgi:hypothetical protein
MTGSLARWLLIAALVCWGVPSLRAAEVESEQAPDAQAQEDKAVCTKNLKQIYEAIQAYQLDHKDLPNWLSDLVPQYLADANVLTCPICRRTGKTEAAPLADPKMPSSYLFEFCPVPLGSTAPKAADKTRREWKRRQMGLVGSVVPLVRCRHHQPVLNLAFDGTIYESPSFWELAFTNRVDARQLTAASLFANEPGPRETPARKPPVTRHFPPRDDNAGKGMLDLTGFYNAMLTENWHRNPGNDLAALPTGVQTLGGVEFDVRGIVQLASKSPSATNFPAQVSGIGVHQKCQRLHFLHAAGFGTPADEGKQIGAYVVHFANNQARLEIPIIYGRTVRNWHLLSNEPKAGDELTVAWTGENAVSRQTGRPIRLFLTTWTNLAPDLEIDSLDFVSTLRNPAPFLIGITAD